MNIKKTFQKGFKVKEKEEVGVLSFESVKKGHTASKNFEHRFRRQSQIIIIEKK